MWGSGDITTVHNQMATFLSLISTNSLNQNERLSTYGGSQGRCWQLQIQTQSNCFSSLTLHKPPYLCIYLQRTFLIQTNTIFPASRTVMDLVLAPVDTDGEMLRPLCAPPPGCPAPGIRCWWPGGPDPVCLWWAGRCLIPYPWSQSDTNKITGWMRSPRHRH